MKAIRTIADHVISIPLAILYHLSALLVISVLKLYFLLKTNFEMKLTYQNASNLISHLKEKYTNWYNSLHEDEKKNTNNWTEFVKQSAKVNNDYNGTEDDFVYTAEDAMTKL